MKKPSKPRGKDDALDRALQRQFDAIQSEETPKAPRRLARRLQDLLDEDEPPK